MQFPGLALVLAVATVAVVAHVPKVVAHHSTMSAAPMGQQLTTVGILLFTALFTNAATSAVALALAFAAKKFAIVANVHTLLGYN